MLKISLTSRTNAWWRKHKVAYLTLLILQLGIGVSESSSYWERMFRGEVDWFMSLYIGQVTNRETVRPLTFVDIDNESFDLNSTADHSSTDRGFIAHLIALAAAQDPIAIVVDVDFSLPTPGDIELQKYLKHYGTEMPPLIIARSLKPGPTGQLQIAPWALGEVKCGNAPIFFASSGFLRDHDGIVRDWNLIEPVLTNGSITGMPSVELLLLAIVDGRDGVKCIDVSKAQCLVDRRHAGQESAVALQAASKAAYRVTNDAAQVGIIRDLNFGDRGVVRLLSKGIAARTFYTIRWPIAKKQPEISDLDDPNSTSSTTLLQTCPASRFMRQSTDNNCTDQPLAGRIVLIGGSNRPSRDDYSTPIGGMPGAMVLLNSINTLLQDGQLHEPPFLGRLAIGVLIAMLVLTCLQVLRRGLALSLTVTFPFILTICFARWLIGSGLWMDFSAPIVAMIVDLGSELIGALTSGANAFWRDYRCVGWRALLATGLRNKDNSHD